MIAVAALAWRMERYAQRNQLGSCGVEAGTTTSNANRSTPKDGP
jgi:hypothetical protein